MGTALRRLCHEFVTRVAISLFALSGLSLVAATGTASIQGIIKSTDGTIIAGANITYGPLAAPHKNAAAAMMPPVGQLLSDSDGAFSIQHLAAGVYLICVSVRNQPYLDPCHWSATPITFTVLDGQAISNAVVTIAKGKQCQIRVNDPTQAFANDGATPGAHLTVGVRALSGALHAAVLVTNDATGRTYSVTIPTDTPVSVYVLSGGYQLKDSTGNIVGASAVSQYQITAPSATAPSVLTFTVTGVNKQ